MGRRHAPPCPALRPGGLALRCPLSTTCRSTCGGSPPSPARGAPRRHCGGHGGAEHLLSIRCSAYVERAVGHQPDGRPPQPHGRCVSAARPLRAPPRSSAATVRCFPRPRRRHTLVETMFLSSHPNLRPTQTIVKRIAKLSKRQALVYDAIHLAHELFLLATEEVAAGADLVIPEDVVRSARGAYVRSIPYPKDSSAEPRRRPPVGGIGLRIRDELLCTRRAGCTPSTTRRTTLQRCCPMAMATRRSPTSLSTSPGTLPTASLASSVQSGRLDVDVVDGPASPPSTASTSCACTRHRASLTPCRARNATSRPSTCSY